ncbi:MAG TPA: hypothetical protein VFW77_01460 [Candidatus Saccharimonadales bacterium]|nr:hypothetical protein [Candidatus Saccharimonadales bacterium]
MKPQVFAARLINLFTGIVIVFLGLRFILKLCGANPLNGFVGWVYDNTSVLLDPFRGIFTNAAIGRHFVLEFNTLFAIVIYALLGMLLLMIVDLLTPGRSKAKK